MIVILLQTTHFSHLSSKRFGWSSVMETAMRLIVLGLFAFFAVEACRDYDKSCSGWEKMGLCTDDRYKDYMKSMCKKSCGLCAATTSPPDCKDFYKECVGWASTGFCTKSGYIDYMRRLCKKSCGLCGGGVVTTAGPAKTFPPVTGSCGKPDVLQGRVIAGVDAKKGAWPWQILMLRNGRTMCGGSLIAPQWVVTAAHCVYGRQSQASSFKVRVGEHITSTTSDGSHQDVAVEKIIVNRKYSPRVLDADIALMKLATPVQFGKYVKPVCLPNQDENVPVGTECYITGWGKIKHPGNMHHTLQQGKMPVVSKADCTNLNTRKLRIPITDNMVCAGHGGATRVSGCHGDSGGPFVCKTGADGRWVLQGAVSWGSGRCDARVGYTVFARVSVFRSWIDQQMAANP